MGPAIEQDIIEMARTNGNVAVKILRKASAVMAVTETSLPGE
jgi:hypothetical protein